MSKQPAFPDEIQLRDAGMRGDSRLFKLTHYYRVVTSLGIVTVPTGFITDGASVPQIFWNILSPFGEYFPAALLHDYLYSKYSDSHFLVDRATADMLFKEAMFNLGVGWLKRETIYRAVRIGGWRSWKKR